MQFSPGLILKLCAPLQASWHHQSFALKVLGIIYHDLSKSFLRARENRWKARQALI